MKKALIVGGISLVAMGVGGLIGYRIGCESANQGLSDLLDDYNKLDSELDFLKDTLRKLADDGDVEETGEEGDIWEEKGKAFREASASIISQRMPETEEDVFVNENGLAFRRKEMDLTGINYNRIQRAAEVAYQDARLDRDNEKTVWGEQLVETEMEKGPYVISVDEFRAGELNYENPTYFYYVEDEVLADENDLVIENAAEIVGWNFDKFGEKSGGDKNAVYIRNDRLSLDIELMRNTSSYAEEVLGLEKEPVPASEGREIKSHRKKR